MSTGPILYQRAKKLIPGGTQLLSKRPEMFLPEQWPSYYSKASGVDVWDLDGRAYVDMTSNGVGSCPLGYADPDVNRAVSEVIEAGSMCTLNTPLEVELAETVCELHPWADMVRYARSGGESMAVAVRIARARTGRSRVAFCGYHGWHDWYLAANRTGEDVLGDNELLLPGLSPAGVPKELAGTALGFRFNDLDEAERIVHEHGRELAAIICEPQRHEAPEPEFLQGLRHLASEAKAVLVFDEISSGMRRTTGGVHLLYGVQPDLAVLGKGVSNGFPMGIVLGTEEVMQSAQDTFISSTYWTEAVGPAAALATIRKYGTIDAPAELIRAGRRVQEIWKDAAERSGLDVDVGHPDMPPFSYIRFRTEEPAAAQALLCQLMLERGFLDNGNFYATCAHTEKVLSGYEATVAEVFPVLARAVRERLVRDLLKGPPAHSTFRRLN